MTSDEIIQLMHDCSDEEYIEFDRVQNKLNRRPDLHAFLLLNQLVPRDRDMVSWASHDEFGLDVDIDELAAAGITKEQVIDLVRCGVRESDGYLCMFA